MTENFTAFNLHRNGRGMEVQDIFEDIANPDPAKDNQDPYAVYIRKLNHHFHVEENIPFE